MLTLQVVMYGTITPFLHGMKITIMKICTIFGKILMLRLTVLMQHYTISAEMDINTLNMNKLALLFLLTTTVVEIITITPAEMTPH